MANMCSQLSAAGLQKCAEIVPKGSAFDELYAYYERTESMYSNVYRDRELVAAIQPALAPFERYLDEAAGILAAGRPRRGRRRELLTAALRHAIDFRTWHSLTAGGRLTRAEAIRLMTALVEAAAAPRAAPSLSSAGIASAGESESALAGRRRQSAVTVAMTARLTVICAVLGVVQVPPANHRPQGTSHAALRRR